MESAMAAIHAGADAIYLGGKNFSARASAQNFSDDELVELIEYAALRAVRVYIAVNTLYKNDELPLVLQFISRMHRAGAAAFILQDAGLAFILKDCGLELHASTQMTVHSKAGAEFMREMGFSRIVLARELDLSEVADIAKTAECEVFVHGALCVGYSGQCLMSAMIGGRSGNRGRCAQICRTEFTVAENRGYFLSPQDMCTLNILDKIAGTGVASLKIEGRMKSAEYVFLATRAYRRRLDAIAGKELPTAQDEQDLLQIFNRGGSFSTGYWTGNKPDMSYITPKSSGTLAGEVVAVRGGNCTRKRLRRFFSDSREAPLRSNGQDNCGAVSWHKIKFSAPMQPGDGIEVWTSTGPHIGTGISTHIAVGESAWFPLSGALVGNVVYKSYSKALADRTKQEMAQAKKQMEIFGDVTAIAGEKLRLKLWCGIATAEEFGDVVEAATNAPMAKEEIFAQLTKTGNTPFKLKLDGNIGEGIYVNKSALNQLRRNAIAMLQAAMLDAIRPALLETPTVSCGTTSNSTITCEAGISVQLSDTSYLQAVLATDIKRVYVPWDNIPCALDKNDTEIYAVLPTISRNRQDNELREALPALEANEVLDGFLVSTFGQLQILKNTTKKIALNHTFNIANSESAKFFATRGEITISQEINAAEIKSLGVSDFELIAYGRQVLMSTRLCPIGNFAKGKCGSNGRVALKDQTGAIFPVETECSNCISFILNSRILDTAAKIKSLQSSGAKLLRLIFTDEDESTVRKIIERYQQALLGKKITPIDNHTYGHYFRGVE